MKKIVSTYLFLLITCAYVHGQYIDTLAIQNMETSTAGVLNTSASEFSPYMIGNKFVYVTEGNADREKDKKVDERYWDLRTAYVLPDGKLIPDAYLAQEINSPYHEGPVSLDSRDSTLYFTRDNYQKGELKKGTEQKVYLQIFKSRKINGHWSDAVPVSFLDRNINICHPAIVPSENLMIFSSNMPDGHGGMDLYKISLDAISIEEAENLGPSINTSGNEVFPVFHEKGYLIYSSDGWTSEYKNYDLFVHKLNGIDSSSVRLESDFSSEQDDLGLFVMPDGKSGYFSSSRVGGLGKDDLYYFKSDRSIFVEEGSTETLDIVEEIIDEDITRKTELKLLFKNPDLTNVNGIDLQIFNSDGQQLIEEYTNVPSSVIISTLNQGESYKIMVKRVGYYPMSRTVYTEDPTDEVLLLLTKIPKPPIVVEEPPRVEKPKEVIIPVDVGSIVVFDNIYYEYNSAQIKSGSADELDALVRAMRKNSGMNIRLVAHTDSRGTNEYNLDLSKRRAESAKKYLVNKGISSSRILTLGVGESQIRNHCKEGVQCSDRAHRYNRRTEVQIIQQ